jgi:hypothetical protein
VFVTDSILTTLMCVKSSVYSWDVVITRVGDQLFLDKRDGGPLDLLTANETAPDQLPEEKDNINGIQSLSLEATTINQNFTQQVGVGGCGWVGGCGGAGAQKAGSGGGGCEQGAWIGEERECSKGQGRGLGREAGMMP